jgi:hypothetical protein
MISSSTPTLTQFDPNAIPYQIGVLRDIRKNFNYNLGTHEILLSGSVGSAKSTLLAHIAITHCLFNPGARFLIGRLSMPALRSTLFNKILEHIGQDLKENVDFFINLTSATIKFSNGSEIISRSWQDKKYFKVRSLELSGAAIEETVENSTQDFYTEIKMRVGRLPHIKENIIVHATNPDSPSHWLYKYFITSQPHVTRHVYYSVTTQNPFLPKSYIDQLKTDLDPKMARRMIYGEWIDITGEIIYYCYDRDYNFINESYEIKANEPIYLAFDFNIAEGKPLSCALLQFTWPLCHIFTESIIHGARTAEIIEDLDDRGYLKTHYQYFVSGDAAGAHRDTRSKQSDYSIIRAELERRNINAEFRVPKSNPPIRTRHNHVNAMFCNSNGLRRAFVYKDAPICDEGFRMTKLKKGANYIEDDSKHFQHCTTAIGYAMMIENKYRNFIPSSTREF